MTLQHLGSNAHACAAQHRRQPQVGLGQMGDVVNNPEGDGKSTGNPGIIRILGVQIALDNLGSLAEMMVHLHEEIRVHQVVRIKDAHGIILLVHGKKLLKHPLQGIALALFGRMGALADNGTGLACHLCRIIRAIIRNHIDIIQFLWIVQLLQILHQLADNRLLIVGCHNHSHLLFRRGNLFFLEPPQPEEADEEKIHRKQENNYLQRYHYYVKWKIHLLTSPLFAIFSSLISPVIYLPARLIAWLMMPKTA